MDRDYDIDEVIRSHIKNYMDNYDWGMCLKTNIHIVIKLLIKNGSSFSEAIKEYDDAYSLYERKRWEKDKI